MKKFFTSESVTEGHPDKICDQISDAILDAILEQDPEGRVACETCCTTGMVLCMGEISTKADIDIPRIAREVIVDIGYDRAKYGFDGHTCSILTSMDEQSCDIAMGVNEALESKEGEDADAGNGAGDQGIMFGYACNETKELMPMPISLAHRLAMQLTAVRKDGTLRYLRPDGKTQVTVEYDDGKPARLDAIVVSSQHAPEIPLEQIREDILEYVIKPVIPAELMDADTKFYINPTGRFVIGGPQGDSGLTGRKSSWTPTGAIPGTGAALSAARIPQRLTAPPHTQHGTLPRTLSLPDWQTSARCSWLTPSAWQSRFPFWWTPSALARRTKAPLQRLWTRCLTCDQLLSSAS